MDPLQIDISLRRREFTLRVALNVADETVALIGPSGAGKTSLLRAVSGLERPDGGRIRLGEWAWLDTDRGIDLPSGRRRVGYLPQDYGLFPHLTVAGNVRFAGRRDRPDLLARFGVEHLAAVWPQQLSDGERQRVALARALSREPRVLLLDEPFGALDAITLQTVREELAGILGHLALPTLLVTHAFEDAIALAGRIGVVDRGRIVQVASANELLHAPASPLVAALTGANVLDGVAALTRSGSTVRLQGGGELISDTAATGPVQVVIHPWELELTEPGAGQLTETVLGVRPDRGGALIRMTRFTVQVPASSDRRAAISEGSLVGIRVAPCHVRVLRPDSGEGAGS